MSGKKTPPDATASPTWRCPGCGGVVRMTGTNEREPLKCGSCEALYRHPRLALLLSATLPGLGSLSQRRHLWGGTVFLGGSGAFLWTLWRLAFHLRIIAAAPAGSLKAMFERLAADLQPLLQEASLGIGVVMLAYALDVAVVWLRRDHLQPW